MRQIGVFYSNSGVYDSSIFYFDKSLELSERLKFNNGIVKAYNNLGIVYTGISNYKFALKYFVKALKLHEINRNKVGSGVSLNNIAAVYIKQSNYPKALEFFLKSLKIKEETKDLEGAASCYMNIGVVYEYQSNYPKALENYNKAVVIFLNNYNINGQPKNKYELSNCYINIGNLYQTKLEYSKAQDYYLKSLKIKEEIFDRNGIADIYGNIGNIYYHQTNYSEALGFYFKALRVKREIGDKSGIIRSYGNISNLNNLLGNFSIAIQYSDSSLFLAKESEDINGMRLAYQYLSDAYFKTGKYREAYENHVKFKLLNDSIFNVENSKQLGDLKTKFEVEKREVELNIKAEFEQDKIRALAEEEKTQQKIIIYSVILVLLIVIVFSSLLYKRFKLTIKQKDLIVLKEKETQNQYEIISEQKKLVSEKHKEITDSINYAERIQRSFLATKEHLNANLTEYFILFKPKDIVSGDFYWSATLNNGLFALVTADSTGHGVPGAIMSLLNIGGIEKAVENYTKPADILNSTRKTIIERLKKDGSPEGGKDGMDASLCVYDFKNMKLTIASANNPVWIIRRNQTPFSPGEGRGDEAQIIEIKPDKMPIGKHDRDSISFTQQEIDLQSGDVIYTLTDGFPDQFGGPNGKKFMSKNLRELLASNAHLPMQEQKQLLQQTFASWVDNMEQVDDVTLIGIRV